jgi:hypothetical protein
MRRRKRPSGTVGATGTTLATDRVRFVRTTALALHQAFLATFGIADRSRPEEVFMTIETRVSDTGVERRSW